MGGNKPKRRVQTVKCTADSLPNKGFVKELEKPLPPPPPPPPQQKDSTRRNSRKQDHSILHKELPPSGSTSVTEASKPETVKKSESKRRSKSSTRKSSHDKGGNEEKAKDSSSSNSQSSDAATKSGTKKDKEESSRKEAAEKTQVKSSEGRAEKKAPSQETPSVTANKENEMKGSRQEQQQLAPLSSPSRDFSPAAAPQPASNTQPKAPKTPSKTSSLAKQAAVMLHDIQSLNTPSTPGKRPGAAGSDVPPRTSGSERVPEDMRPSSADSPRTPARQKKGKEGEGTPKHLIPPNTPDVPTCSPASEAGSENSINMAAHTLMILSRAAIARTGTPLKDSLRQEGADKKLSSKNSKKRKQASSPTGSPPAKKDRVSQS